MSQEEGNAIVEFIGWSAVLLVPVLYLVVTLAQLQATTFAVASAADALRDGQRAAGHAAVPV